MIIALSCVALMLVLSCSRQDHRTALIGEWEWTGDSCRSDGNCKKEIITDEENREVFTREGLYISKRAKIGYVVEGAEIRLASDKKSFKTVYGEIVSIDKKIMLLKTGDTIRRYARVGPAK
ncbi:MAG: hypothetical protein KA369_21925 [Spirochaetes bacterium]|nr:hypothetical protein [Spirochaetota bacterium]